MKQKSTATVLCFFLGGVGGHRFYLDKPISGIFYLLFCWTFIPSIIALVEFFVLLFMSEEKFNKENNAFIMQEKMSAEVAKTEASESSRALRDLAAFGELLEKKIITKEEFDLKKSQLLKRIG